MCSCQLALFGQARLGDDGIYDPANPGDPQVPVLKHQLRVEASPQQGGSFNVVSEKVSEGGSISLYAYPDAGFVFKGWMQGDSLLSETSPYTYTMGSKDAVVKGLFEYDPANPSNPNANAWDASTGEVIVDDFEPGRLSSAVSTVIGGNSNESKVTMVVVSGEMSSYDFGFTSYYENCTLLDLSRSYGYAEIPSYGFDGSSLTTVILPSCVESIGYNAFYGCENLADLTCYAVVPPTVEDGAFDGLAEGAVLHVLSSSISLYAEAEGWKDFTILPLSENVQALEVTLPADGADGRYKNMTLELVNARSGQRQKFVISDRLVYTFNGLLKDTEFNVYVRNERGAVLGQIDGIAIADEDVRVAFESLLQPRDVALKVTLPDGTDVTSSVQATWLDANGQYMQQGNRVSGLLAGTALTCRVSLPQELGMSYLLPQDTVYTVQDGANELAVALRPLAEVTVSGRVTDVATGMPLAGAAVSVSQRLNGLYSKAFIANTDSKGGFSLKVYNDQSTIVVSASDYLNATFERTDFNASADLGEVALKAISGATITTNYTYTSSAAEGETADVENWYSDYANVSYTIYNETAGREITQFSVQYPTIVLLEEVAVGDSLRLTASSRTGAFRPVEAGTRIGEDNRAEVTLPIVELGGIRAGFSTTDNASVVGILYDGNGQLVKKYNYTNAALSITGLSDGEYTLVTMANSSLFNSILNLSQFAASGLTEGTDYVQNTVEVESGMIAVIENDLVPVLDESKLYYTGDNTMFSVNKTSVVAGNYLTLKGKIDFRNEYASQVSDVSMVVDLPASCSFVENSVMVGSKISSYTIDGSRLTVPLSRYGDEVKFCVIPTDGGDYAPSAFASFTMAGEEILQPIGSANYTVKDLSITVPSTVAKTTIPVNGTALGNSTVQIYDNGVLIGETTSLANGVWSTTCELYNPGELSLHPIYAQIVSKDGVNIQTENQELKYDKNAIQVSSVAMINTAHGATSLDPMEYVTVFDFENPSISSQTYWYWPNFPDFTFMVDFTRNDTSLISNVLLHVKTSSGEVVRIPANYDSRKACWIAMYPFDSYSLPLNTSVSFSYMNYNMCDSLHCLTALENGMGDVPVVEGYERLTDCISVCDMISQSGDITMKCIYAAMGGEEKDVLLNGISNSDFELVLDNGSYKYYATETNAYQIIRETPDSVFAFAYFGPDDMASYDAFLSLLYPSSGISLLAAGFAPGADEIAPSTDRLNQWRDMIIQDAIDEANSKLKCADEATNIQLHNAVMRLRQCVGVSIGSFLAHSMNLVNSSSGKPNNVIEAGHTMWEASNNAADFGSEMDNLTRAGQEYLKIIHDAPGCGGGGNGGNSGNHGGADANYVMDPSGYVYEGVSSNRVEGVTATCYYKETVEDMYGDKHENVVLWNAAEYAQENPLFTDENGMYRWDVPQGLWQVKFEKEGYETTYSEWLPVPPPQLEVNIGLTQNRQPEVAAAHAYEDGVEVEFDKYMMTDKLTTENIFVTKNGEDVAGTVTLLDEEQAYEDNPVTYASKVRFVPEVSFLATDEVVLTVGRKVQSYAGVPMEADYTQAFDIEREVKQLVADSLVKVAYTGSKTLTVSALPYDAGIGKKLVVKSSSEMIASVSADTLQLNENGQATFTVGGELPGTSVISFALTDADVKGSSIIQVTTETLAQTAAPVASRASGTAVYRGSTVELSSETENATIYYTTDGTCPCDENGTRQVYTGPIAITENMTLKAQAVSGDLEDSEVAEFSYTVKTAATGLTLHSGWNWISHGLEAAVPATELQENAERIVGQETELVKDPTFGLTGNLDELDPQEAYKVQVSEDTQHTLGGYAFNPATPFSLKTGWNWLGYPMGQTMTLAEAFADAEPEEEDYIVGQDGFAQFAEGVWTGTLNTLVPGKGYLYHSQGDKQFTYNADLVSKAQALYASGLPNAAPWAVDKYQYPDIMCLVADLYDGGLKVAADEYAVGAFCGTECRGIGRYVDGKLMMNIYGEAGETITFKAMEEASEQLYGIRETAVFEETLLGSLNRPYTLNLGDTETGISAVESGWKVWLDVASDKLYVSHDGGTVDKVSLTDVYGSMVLVQRDVQDGAGIDVSHLADGVYIVTAQVGSEVHYKKIVKAGR